jgi:hypothetical protein
MELLEIATVITGMDMVCGHGFWIWPSDDDLVQGFFPANVAFRRSSIRPSVASLSQTESRISCNLVQSLLTWRSKRDEDCNLRTSYS